MKKLVFAIVLVFALVITAVAFGGAADKAKPNKRTKLDSKPKIMAKLSPGRDINVVTTIQYDPNTSPDTTLDAGTAGTYAIVGNLFNTDSGAPLLASGTVTAFTFFPTAAYGGVIASLLGPPMGGTGTSHYQSFGVSGVVDSAINFATLTTPIGIGNSFIGGLYLGYFAGYPGIGMQSSSYNSQGFHGMVANFVFISTGNYVASGATALSGQNAMFRVSGDLELPVELMNFTVK